MVKSVRVVEGGADMVSTMISLGEMVWTLEVDVCSGAGWLMGSNEATLE